MSVATAKSLKTTTFKLVGMANFQQLYFDISMFVSNLASYLFYS